MVQFQTSSGEPGALGAHDYGLAPLPQLPCPEWRGPTPWSNWVLRGRLLAGAYPASLDDDETERILTTLLELGVNTFVCLQAEFSLHTPEAAWRAGQGLRPYIKDAQKLLIRARESGSRRILQDKLDFLHLPIIDGSVTSDVALSRLADDCCTRILRGERLYVHCWGGHGRTGTVIAVMLGRMYGISCAAALRFTQAFHDSRKYPQGVRSPQTTPQVAQVKRLLPDPPSVRGVVYPRDPSVILDDTILRPGTAPSAAAAPAPARAAAQPSLPSKPALSPQGLSAAGGAGAGRAVGSAAEVAGAAAELAEMDIDEAPALPAVPVNQQRKEAIRAAKQAGSGGPGTGTGIVAGAASALSAALQAAAIVTGQQRGAAAAAAANPSSPTPAQRQHDWLQSVFGKSLAREVAQQWQGAAADGGKAIGVGAQQSLGGQAHKPQEQAQQAQQEAHLHLKQAGYLQQYVQHQRLGMGSTGGKASSGGSGNTFFLTATSGSAAGVLGGEVDYSSNDAQRVDMRPSKLTVAVPDLAAAERSASSVQRMRNYLSGQR